MKFFDYIDRINQLHKLIREERTGTPEILAKKLNISASRLYVILDELKLKGAPIAYSRIERSYYYTANFEMQIITNFQVLTDKEIEKISAGYFSNSFFTTFFV